MTQRTPSLGAVQVHGMTRSAFILRGALAAGALYGAGAASPVVRGALAQSTDIDILNFALTLEYLEAEFYARARKLSLRTELAELAVDFGDDERQHVDALIATIRGLEADPEPVPSFTFPLKDERDFLKLAVELEDTGVSAYNGAAPRIEDKAILAAAGSIVQVEAKHAAAIRGRAGMDPSPAAFEPTLSREEVLKAVEPLLQTAPG